jgi:sulfatase modifying factor 1
VAFFPSSRPIRGACAWLFALGLALSACGGTTNEPNAASLQDGSVDSGSAADTKGSADAGLDATDATPESGVDAGPPPSCAAGGPGMTNCGLGGSGTESCCTSLEVTGGAYYRTYDQTLSGPDYSVVLAPDGGPTDEAAPATVSAFRLDRYKVTVGRFRQFVNAWNGGWLPPVGSGKHAHLNGGSGLRRVSVDAGLEYETGWAVSDDSEVAPTNANLTTCSNAAPTWTPSAAGNENLPIICINWQEAYAFCIWDGGFLPSDAEWGCAAAGGSQQREYPWGETAPGTANQYAIWGCYYPSGGWDCSGESATMGGMGTLAPVGTAWLGAGLWGQLDLAGEVFEWTLDWFSNPYSGECTDCALLSGPVSFWGRSLRGSIVGLPYAAALRSESRIFGPGPGDPDRAIDDVGIGFRCARAP